MSNHKSHYGDYCDDGDLFVGEDREESNPKKGSPDTELNNSGAELQGSQHRNGHIYMLFPQLFGWIKECLSETFALATHPLSP